MEDLGRKIFAVVFGLLVSAIIIGVVYYYAIVPASQSTNTPTTSPIIALNSNNGQG
ncbi:MAG: hypothetical protein M0T78_05140 [Actinomycetota bacterium]|nr:hypothetical protein [Actinomycetota bacterium]